MKVVEGSNYKYDRPLFTNKGKCQNNSYGIDKVTIDKICG